MCSCHTAINRERANPGAPAGPATASLRREHEIILRALTVLDRAADRLGGGGPVDETALEALVDLLRAFADRCHHGKEEEHLFPALRAKGLEAPLAPFLEDHEKGRDYLGVLASGARAAERAGAARRYVGLLRDHIQREDEVLFPMADEALGCEEQTALARAYDQVEQVVLGPGVHERLLETLSRAEAAIPGGPP